MEIEHYAYKVVNVSNDLDWNYMSRRVHDRHGSLESGNPSRRSSIKAPIPLGKCSGVHSIRVRDMHFEQDEDAVSSSVMKSVL